MKNAAFETGVCKTQNGATNLMTEDEKQTCQRLLLVKDADLSDDAEEEVLYEERLRRWKWKWENSSGYRNAHCILGSAAEVERLWSIATHVLTDEQKNTSPLMLEAILFL